jgi:hypothetical protein
MRKSGRLFNDWKQSNKSHHFVVKYCDSYFDEYYTIRLLNLGFRRIY